MSARTKKKVTTIINSDEVTDQVRKFSNATSRIKAIEAEIEIEKQAILKRYERKLSQLNEERDDSFDALQDFAEANTDLFSKAKSIDYPNGKIGFRMGTPKVEKSKKLTWEGVIEELKALAPDYVRTKEEVNKELVIANRNDVNQVNLLAASGITVIQTETFFVEAKEEDLVTN
jgi:phage host-nuclease inhibitor protein Gam